MKEETKLGWMENKEYEIVNLLEELYKQEGIYHDTIVVKSTQLDITEEDEALISEKYGKFNTVEIDFHRMDLDKMMVTAINLSEPLVSKSLNNKCRVILNQDIPFLFKSTLSMVLKSRNMNVEILGLISVKETYSIDNGYKSIIVSDRE